MAAATDARPAKPIEQLMIRQVTLLRLTGYHTAILESIKKAVRPPLAPHRVAVHAVADILAGRNQFWAILVPKKETGSESTQFVGGITTCIMTESADENLADRWLECLTLYCGVPVHPKAWDPVIDALEKFARRNGCKRIEFNATRGAMAKFAGRLGFRPKSTYYAKPINMPDRKEP